MPVRRGIGGDASWNDERIAYLEKEMAKLRQEVVTLRGLLNGEHGGGNAVWGWITTILAAIAFLMSMVAILRH
jgi:hypothetical protein